MLTVFPSFKGSVFKIWLLPESEFPVTSPLRLVKVLCVAEHEILEINIRKVINRTVVKKQVIFFLFLLSLSKKFFIKNIFI